MDEGLAEFLQEFCEWKAQEGDPVEFVTDGETDVHWVVLHGRTQPISVSLSELPNDRWDQHAVIVQVMLGPLAPDADARGLMRYSRSQLVVSRLSLSADEELIIESSVPASCISLALLDHMIREVGSVALDFLGKSVRPEALSS